MLTSTGAAGESAPAPPEARPALPSLQRHRQRQPGHEQEQADDAAALHGPQRVGVEVLLRTDPAEVVQVEGQVESAIQTIAAPRSASSRSKRSGLCTQRLAHRGVDDAQFGQRGVDVRAPPFQVAMASRCARPRTQLLGTAFTMRAIQIQVMLISDATRRWPWTQDQCQPRPVGPRVHTRGGHAPRLQQALVLGEADGAREMPNSLAQAGRCEELAGVVMRCAPTAVAVGGQASADLSAALRPRRGHSGMAMASDLRHTRAAASSPRSCRRTP